MYDGHSGIENPKINEGSSGKFYVVLSALKQGTGRIDFVVHITSHMYVRPRDFLSRIGFPHFEGICQFHGDGCYYREIATLEREVDGFDNHEQVRMVHEGFKNFAGKIGALYELYEKEAEIISNIGMKLSPRAVLGLPITLTITESDIPLWVNNAKFPQLLDLEKQRDDIQNQINGLAIFLPLLCGTGSVLENAVIDALKFLGLKAEKTAKGFTADVIAQTIDGRLRFGIEVTGINDAVKKNSNKLTQVLEFERVKENNEKTVLIANTYNSTPIDKRKGLEDFTKPVLEFLGVYPILLMTSWDLYRLVQAVLNGSRSREEIVEALYKTNGRLVLE